MTRNALLLAGACLPLLFACQTDPPKSADGTKHVATLPKSAPTASATEFRITVPKLGDAGVASDLRQALMALPEVTQVLPNLMTNEVVVQTRDAITSLQLMQVLQSLGLQGTVR
ncbi:MAG: hypothetical protein H6830_00500 [Planctomycetes bacterium]|nr:hypothetical protein [Planctomycetota bacterium]MCB9911142.1 hypothetical protein [Planctomycetota bacterium]HPF13604.1 hypothetical protein [Planctomycetota bacterium]HRV80794.1 hypothetical protein [Planctomycetota bacterium]